MTEEEYQKMYEAAKAESVNHTESEKDERNIPLDVHKKSIGSSLKRAVIMGVTACVLTTSIALFMTNAMKSRITNYSNPSFDKGYKIVQQDKNQTTTFALNMQEAADAYSEDLDFDSFVYGVYSNVNRDGNLVVPKMNNLFYWMSLYGYTEFTTFEDYCISNGYVKEENGKQVVDLSAYRNGSVLHLRELKENGNTKEEAPSKGK